MLPIDLKIMKYYLWEQFFYRSKIRKAIQDPAFQTAAKKLRSYSRTALPNKTYPLEACTFTIFDLETTGFFPELGDEIISIGAVKVTNLEIDSTQSFYQIVKPLGAVPKHTEQLTGLKRQIIQQGHSFPEALASFLDFSHNTILVAHPASFDIPFLQKTINSWRLPAFEPAFVDSLTLANHLHPSENNFLDELVSRYQIKQRQRHHALNDASMTAEVFIELIKECIERDCHTEDDLLSNLK